VKSDKSGGHARYF